MRLPKQIALQLIRAKFKLLSALSKRKAAEKAFLLFCTPQHRNKKKLPPVFSSAECLIFPFGQYKVQGYRWNAAADKKVLILHGYESSIINFERYVQPLVAKGYCVLGFDAPAHGRSSGTTINVLIYKEFILTLINKYGPVKNFLAHSLGGLALSLALEETDHDASCKVVLVAPATETTTAISQFLSFIGMNNSIRKEFDAIIQKQSGHPSSWFSVQRAAANIKASVLWLHDRDDYMTPLHDALVIQEAEYPNFQFTITKGLGHRRIYRDAVVTKEIIRFF